MLKAVCSETPFIVEKISASSKNVNMDKQASALPAKLPGHFMIAMPCSSEHTLCYLLLYLEISSHES